LVVQLPEGLHRVEVSSDGYESFSSDVSIRRGETTSLNVALKAR
jgi:PEGA domain